MPTSTHTRENFKSLSENARQDPKRSARIDAYKRAIRDGLALGELREGRGDTQAAVAEKLGTSQANVSRIERQDDLYLSTLSGYVAALGGRLELRAVFDDQTVDLVRIDADQTSS
jgi:DNA-binding XRE family transcriptional regulator